MVIRTLKILAGLLVYENLPQIQSKLFQCNDLPLFVLFFRGNSRITIFHQNQPPSNVFSKHIVRLPPTAGTSLREPVGGDVNSGGAVVQVFSAAVSPFACTNSKVIVTLRPHGLMAP